MLRRVLVLGGLLLALSACAPSHGYYPSSGGPPPPVSPDPSRVTPPPPPVDLIRPKV